MSKINSFAGFNQLNEVWLGGVYPADFYYDFDPSVRDAFEKITEMTNEDLTKIQEILQSRNIIVRRPTFTNNRDDYIGSNGNLIKPPIMPRDTELALGNSFYHIKPAYRVDPWESHLTGLDGVIHHVMPFDDLACLAPPSVVRCGKDLYIDIDSHQHVMPQVALTFVEWAKDYRVHLVSTGGHSDSVFCPVSEGLIITTHWKTDYSKTFPGWEVFKLPMESNFIAGPDRNWWVPNQQVSTNSLFAQHIEERALNWVGDYRETQFSVNMLVIDDKTVLAVNQNPTLTEFLTKKGIEVIIADFRCKSFWDGGIHCLTSDINRTNTMTNYFPQRGNNCLDWIL